MAVKVQDYLDRCKSLDAEKVFWNNHWQLVAEYFNQRKATFTTYDEPGAFLHGEIWDNTGSHAVEASASALLGMIWPNNESFHYRPMDDEDDELKEYFGEATKVIQQELSDPRANLDLALSELMEDYLTFGTTSLHAEQGSQSLYSFQAWNVQQFSIDEGDGGMVDTFYRSFKLSSRQLIAKFNKSDDKIHENVKKLFARGKYSDKVKILHVIAPRDVKRGGGTGKQNMPYMSLYIDVDNRHVIREGGFEELPTFCVRASKRINEKYGRSRAMRALPDVMELNAVWEALSIAMEKNLDPPLGVYDTGTFAPGTIDTSPGAINTIKVTGNLANMQPIQPLYTVGDFRDVVPLIEKLEQNISEHFMLDKLIDFNNDTQMTAREFLGRASIRQSLLFSFNSRMRNELFDRLLARCFNIALRANRIGYVEGSAELAIAEEREPEKDHLIIPQKLIDAQESGEPFYRIEYITPSAREQRAQEGTAIIDLWALSGEIAAVKQDPKILNRLNPDRSIIELSEINGVPEGVLNDDDEKEELDNIVDDEAQNAQDLNQASVLADAANQTAQAQAALAG